MAELAHIHGGNLRKAAEQYGLSPGSILDFSANINPLGPSTRVLQAITDNMSSITHYPDPEAAALRSAAAEYLGLSREMIVAGNGAVEIIYLLTKVLGPFKAMIPAPTFNEYEIAVKTGGGQVSDLMLREENEFRLDVRDIIEVLAYNDLVFICNPNNPTGCLTSRADLEKVIREAAKLGKPVIVDEAFMDFVPGREDYSVVDLVGRFDNLFVLYSLTKFFAIPGLRLGLGLGNPSLIERLNHARDPWNVNCFAQLAGPAGLADRQYIQDTVDYVSKEKEYLYQGITSVPGLRALPPAVNYVFVNVEDTGFSSAEITDRLARLGILVRDCASYKNLRPVFIRAAVRTRAENDVLIGALRGLGRK